MMLITSKQYTGVIIFLSIVFNSPVSSESSTLEETENIDSDEVKFVSLENLDDKELENICTSRGFELIPNTDPVSGDVLEYTHEDYVEAAQQCLDVETEMEKMFQQNPGILKDLEKERDRMQAEKEKLEAEILSKQAELEAKRKEHQQRQEEYLNTAFIQHDDDRNSTTGLENETNDSDAGPDNVELDNDKGNDKKESLSKPIRKNSKIQPLPNNNDGVETKSKKRNKYNPLSLHTIVRESVQELRSKISNDVKLVTNVLFPPWVREPVIQQILIPLWRVAKLTGANTLDMMKTYMKVVVEDLTNAQQRQKEEAQES